MTHGTLDSSLDGATLIIQFHLADSYGQENKIIKYLFSNCRFTIFSQFNEILQRSLNPHTRSHTASLVSGQADGNGRALTTETGESCMELRITADVVHVARYLKNT